MQVNYDSKTRIANTEKQKRNSKNSRTKTQPGGETICYWLNYLLFVPFLLKTKKAIFNTCKSFEKYCQN